MARTRARAAATMVLAVCLVTGIAGRSPKRGIEGMAERIGTGSVAAGRAHSLLATPDGRLFAWGAGLRGQIGDGALVDRWSPVSVPEPGEVIAVAAGAVHSLALTTSGEVYAWGANASGRLGDGTRKRRPRPVRVAGVSGIRSIAAGLAHSLAVTIDGRVFAWGLNDSGQLGIGNRTESWVPVQVVGLSDIVSVAAGDVHSLAVARDGRLFAWGGNALSALGDGTTTDRLLPVAVGLVDVVAVAAGSEHSLALLSSGMVYSWGRGANGELGTGSTQPSSSPARVPNVDAVAIAAGRHFSAAIRRDQRVMTWGANAAGQLGDGTTTRRLRPVVVTGLDSVTMLALGDAHAIAVTASGDVRTWGKGASGRLGLGSEIDQSLPADIVEGLLDWNGEGDEGPVDIVAPTIIASTTPPLQPGWMTAPVTVTFSCTDDVAVASCSSPVTVAQDGFAQEIVGTAVDQAGNRSFVSVVLNMDLNPPVLSIVQPEDAAVVQASEVIVVGNALDLGAGVAAVRCNGAVAELTAGSIRCVIPLRPGRNDIVLQAIDGVGRTASAALTVTRAGAATRLTLTPSNRAAIVEEVIALSVRDEFGVAVANAQWSTSDDSIVSLSDSDPPVVTAVGIGEATITAERDGVSTTASIVVASALQPGAVRWTVPQLPGLIAGQPLIAHRVDAAGPHLFAADIGAGGETTLRAVTSDGEVLWHQDAPGVPLMGDSFGGVVTGVPGAAGDYGAYVRSGGGSVPSWRYESEGRLGRPAQSWDGTIYTFEQVGGGLDIDGNQVWDKYAAVLDGATGTLINRALMAPEIDQFISDRDGETVNTNPPTLCRSTRRESAPATWGPVAGADGRGYFVVRRLEVVKHADCAESYGHRTNRVVRMGLDLVSVSTTGEIQVTNLFSTECSAAVDQTLPCDLPVRALQLMPDGIGGTLVTWERATQAGLTISMQRSLTRVDADGAVERQVGSFFGFELIGQSGTAIAFDGGWNAQDVVTGEVKWASPLRDVAILAARPDGGVATLDTITGELKIIDANAQVESTQPFGLHWSAVHEFGDWIGLRGNTLAAVVGNFANATRFAPGRGNAQSQLTVRKPGMGIMLKSQSAKPPFPIFHTAIKIAPMNQRWAEAWYAAHPQYSPQRDLYQNLYFMLGAGLPNGEDTASNCIVPGLEPLVSDTNRDGDVTKPAERWTELPVSERDEAASIDRLLDFHERFTDNAPYACFPEDLAGFYNSNSYAHTLLIHAQVPHDDRQPLSPSPGWKTTIPLTYFPTR